MQIHISGHHLDVTDSLKDYVNSKLDRLSLHNSDVSTINVILSVEKLVQKAEANIHVNGKDLFAEATSADLYAAIDALANKLDRQIIKHKEKHQSHR